MVFTYPKYGHCVAFRGQAIRQCYIKRPPYGSRAYYRHKKRKPFASHQFCVRHQG